MAINIRAQHLREMRDRVDEKFLRDLDLYLRIEGVVTNEQYQRLSNQALVGGRLDKMIREEIAWVRQRRGPTYRGKPMEDTDDIAMG